MTPRPTRPGWTHERALQAAGALRIAGVDEVGRGPLAGPVVAAAVILPVGARIRGLRDSKQLTPAQREALAQTITRRALGIAVAHADAGEIDRLNILRAAMLAMRRALAAIDPAPDAVIVDGPVSPDCPWPTACVVDGDALCMSVAAASVIAKVVRDAWMVRLDAEYPGYGFAQHKGYGTDEHHNALRALGPCPEHRRRFLSAVEQRPLVFADEGSDLSPLPPLQQVERG